MSHTDRTPMPTDAELEAGARQVLQLLRARVVQVMHAQTCSGRLDLTAPLDYRAGWAIGILGRLLGIPPELRPEWSAQPGVEAVGFTLARAHEAAELEARVQA